MNRRTMGTWFLLSLFAGKALIFAQHEQPPTMPWIKPVHEISQSTGSFRTPCVSHVTRDGYTSIQVNVDAYGCNIAGDAANEPSIAIDPTDTKKIAVGWRQFDSVLSDFRQAGWAYSHDAGHTWVFQGSLTPGVFGSDPVLAAGPDGEIYYLSLSQDELRLFRSFNGGASWLPKTTVFPLFLDKPWMSVDTTTGFGRGIIYVVVGGVFRSVDQGGTFVGIGAISDPATLTAVGPDSALYALGASLNRSSNAWNTQVEFEADLESSLNYEFQCSFPKVPTHPGNSPNPGGLPGQDWVVSELGTPLASYNLYALVSGFCPQSLDQDIFVERSSDRGATWTVGKRVNDDSIGNGAWQWFYMMSVAPNGRIDVVWNDTRNFPNPPETSSYSELFYSCSTDQGDTWSPNVPVSPVFDSYVGWPQQAKIGDYYHMLSDNVGVNIVYAATFNGEQDVYFLRIGPWDCNGNQIDDAEDISSGTSLDCNGNGVPDECEYRADFDGDGLTTYNDFATFLYDMRGPDAPLPPPGCAQLSDIDHDGDVDLKDFYGLQQVFVTP